MQGGRSWWVVQVADEAALRALRPDWDAVAALAESTDSMGVFAYAFSDGSEGFDLAVRAFVGNGRRFEDAASGPPMQCWPRGWTCATRCHVAVRRSKSARAAKSATMRA